MIKQVGLTIQLDKTRVICKCTFILNYVHNGITVSPGTCNALGCRISQMLRNTSGRIEHIIQAVTFKQPGTFFVGSCAVVDFFRTVSEVFVLQIFLNNSIAFVVRNHIFIQLYVPQIWISPIEICLSVVVDINRWVDIAIANE